MLTILCCSFYKCLIICFNLSFTFNLNFWCILIFTYSSYILVFSSKQVPLSSIPLCLEFVWNLFLKSNRNPFIFSFSKIECWLNPFTIIWFVDTKIYETLELSNSKCWEKVKKRNASKLKREKNEKSITNNVQLIEQRVWNIYVN